MDQYDVAVIGAGAAGMMCAAVAGQRGRRVVLIEHAQRLAEKIRISGGGRCNFTNLNVGPEHFVSQNPHFCRSALARYTPQDFLALVRKHGIAFHEKHKGQLFCDDSSERIIEMLRAECETGGVHWRMPCTVESITRVDAGYEVATAAGAVGVQRVVIATGGMSIPKIGATDFGLRMARQFGLKVIEPQPALVPLTFDAASWAPFSALSGVAVEVGITCNEGHFREDLLFTHRGLSGPAVLQISTFWRHGDIVTIDLAPGVAIKEILLDAKTGSRQALLTVLAQHLPRRVVESWCTARGIDPARKIAEIGDRTLIDLADALHGWSIVPNGSEGFRKAEVMRGGVDTRELAQATMEARRAPGLHFIGEVVDVTGWLGGYNFHWAWASGHAAGEAV